jgi:hypothetical protein
MSSVTVTLAAMLALSASHSAFSADRGVATTPSSEAKTLDTLVVTGSMPGPGLWRVSKDDHTLWILGTVSPLPKDMTWDSAEVDELVAGADEVLTPGGAWATVGAGNVFKIMLLAPSAFAAIKNPNGKRLVDVLPKDMYQRWSELKQKYIGKNRKIERRRPMFASVDLHSSAVFHSGMTRDATVWHRVADTAKRHGVPVTDTVYRFKLDIDRKRMKSGIRSFAATRPLDVECMGQTLDTLEVDLEKMKRGANAWATGDLTQLRQLEHDDLQPACKRLQDAALGFMEAQHHEQASTDLWLEKAENALSRNHTTVAVVPIRRLLHPHGLLATLRARGYSVVEPDLDADYDEETDAGAVL